MFIQPYACRNVLIEGVTIRNSPMYEVHPVLCRNVTVRGLTISSHGPNNDGCDPESSADVLIEGCTFDTGDDCIAIKSGRNRDGRRVNMPSENLIVRGCVMKDGHGGVTIGSEASGGVRNVFAEDCKMDSPNLDRVLRLKTNSVRGGTIENIYMRNVTAGQVSGAAVDIDLNYEEGNVGQVSADGAQRGGAESDLPQEQAGAQPARLSRTRRFRMSGWSSARSSTPTSRTWWST